MAPSAEDSRMMSVHPRIRYNTIGGINGPLVILENVNLPALARCEDMANWLGGL